MSIKVAGKALSRTEATVLNTEKAAFVVGITSPSTRQDAYLSEVLNELKTGAKSTIKEIQLDSSMIKEHAAYQRTKDIRIEKSDLLDPSRLSPEKLQKLMILPPEHISPEWADPQALKDLLDTHGDSQDHLAIGASPQGPVRPFLQIKGKFTTKQLKQAITDYPEIRTWAVFKKLSTDKKLSAADQAIVTNKLRCAPVVIQGAAK